MIKIPTTRTSFLLHFIGRQKISFIIFFISSLAAALSASIWPVITGELIDSISSYEGDKLLVFNSLSHVFLGAISFWILIEILERVKGFTGAVIYPRLESNIRMSTFEYVNHHSHSYFSNNYVGGIANRIADLPKSTSIVIDFLFNNLLPLVIAIIFSTFIFTDLNVYLALIWFSWLAIHVGVCGYAGYQASEYSKIHSDSRSELQGKIVDTLINHLNVKLYSMLNFELDNARKAQYEEFTKNRATYFFIEKLKLFLSGIAFIGISCLAYYTVYLWQHEMISLGNMITVINSIIAILAMAWAATVEVSYLFRELGVIKQALKLINDPIEIKDSATAEELQVIKGKIVFNKVTFKYRRNDNVFKEKSLTINGGLKTGLVGFSGSGKTTFAHLILRLFELESGKITIDGSDISKVSLKSLRDNICLIPQEPVLFNRSIMDNIRYAKLDATDEEVIEASIKANCHEFIMNFEDGYDTIVGERGSRISGGQKQRIAIARAILKNAPILIMDEATSALDSYTEKQIQDSLNYLTKGKTTIIIAHRLSTLLEVDRILVFDKGTIVEDGTHSDLIKKSGHYAMLWKMQTAGLLPDMIDK